MTAVEYWEQEIDGHRYAPLDPGLRHDLWNDEVFTTPGRADAMWQAGFQPVNAAAWYRAGLVALGDADAHPDDVAAEASRWRVLDFEPEEVSPWQRVLDGHFENRLPDERLPLRAMAWRRAGFDPDTAAPWLADRGGYRPQELELAASMAHNDWSPEEGSLLELLAERLDMPAAVSRAWRLRWVETGRTPCEVLCYVKAGARPEEAATLGAWRDRDHLLLELRAREADLPPHDETAAEAVNELVRIANDGAEPDVPVFCCERLPDWRDEIEPGGEDTERDVWCAGTGKDGGFIPSVGDEWNIRCPDCGAMWAGGSFVPEHKANVR